METTDQRKLLMFEKTLAFMTSECRAFTFFTVALWDGYTGHACLLSPDLPSIVSTKLCGEFPHCQSCLSLADVSILTQCRSLWVWEIGNHLKKLINVLSSALFKTNRQVTIETP